MKRLLIFLSLIAGLFFVHSCLTLSKSHNPPTERQKHELTNIYLEAFQMEMIGRIQDATEIYFSISNIDKSHSASRYRLALLYMQQNNFSDALKFIKEALQKEQNNKWYLELLAEIYDKSGDKKSELSVFKDLVKKSPQDVNYYFEIANLYLYLNDFKNALETITEIEEKFGTTTELSIQKYQLLLYQNKKQEAMKELQLLRKNFPDELEYRILLADFYYREGRLFEAIAEYTNIVQQAPQRYEVAVSLAESYLKLRNLDKAVEILGGMLQNTEIPLEPKMNIMRVLFDMSQNDRELNNKCYSLLDVFSKTHSEEAKVHAIYGDFLYRDKRISEAITEWKITIKYDPSKFLVWQYLFFALTDLEEYGDLYDYASKSIEYFPEQPLSHYFTGFALYKMQDYNKCIPFLVDAADLSSDKKELKIESLNILAESYRRVGNDELSDKTFDELLQIDPENHLILNNYSYYLALRNTNLEKAEKMSFKTVKAYPDNATFLDTYGYILLLLKQYSEAEKYLKKANEISNNSRPALLLHYGDLLYETNRKEEAVTFWLNSKDKGASEDEINLRLKKLQ